MKNTEAMERKLFDELCNFHREQAFVFMVCANAECDEDRQTIIDFINQKEPPSVQDVIWLAIEIDQRRHPENYEDIPEEEQRKRG